ncbi:MAG: glucosaminidase domain-containing protein [Phascolarctobacterium sp.]|nr:glucosaminidase domain-containing protein [Phascolarctobacterium sp.]
MKFLKFPAVLAVASCFFINSIANATVKAESELIDAKLPVKVEKQIVKPEAPAQNKKVVVKKESNIPKQKVASQNKKELPKPKVVPVKKEYFRGMELPANYKSISIFGNSVATKGQAVNLIKANGNEVKLDCSIEDIVNLYWVEAEREGVRPDIALAQALVETGYFGYGGTVKPKQNNFCGLGTTGKKVKGAKFKSPEIGVRAHIQHLLAYSVMKKPSTNIVDPRYDLAHAIRKERGFIDKWSGLQGTWAMGSQYCEKIMVIYQAMLGMEMSEAEKKELLAKQKLAQEQHEARLKKDKKYRKQFEQEAKEREKARKQAEKEAKKLKKSKDK